MVSSKKGSSNLVTSKGSKQIAEDWEREHASTLRDDDHPWGFHWGGDSHMVWVEEILEHEFKDKRVFEIGCGGGKYSKLILDLGASELLACDVHTTAVDGAYEYEPRGRYVLSDGENIPAEDDSFDLVFTYDVLLHLPPSLVVQYLTEGRRVAPEMIVQFPSLDLKGGCDWFGQYVVSKAWRNPYHLGYFNFYADAQIRAYAQIAGWPYIKELGANERDKVWKLEK